MVEILNVEFKENYIMEISLSNRKVIKYNMKLYLKKARFMDLQAVDLFENGQIINKRIIRWNNITEIELEEILREST